MSPGPAQPPEDRRSRLGPSGTGKPSGPVGPGIPPSVPSGRSRSSRSVAGRGVPTARRAPSQAIRGSRSTSGRARAASSSLYGPQAIPSRRAGAHSPRGPSGKEDPLAALRAWPLVPPEPPRRRAATGGGVVATFAPELIPSARPERLTGVKANERLTSATGLVLMVLLFAEGLTIPFIAPLLSWHIRIGLLLVPLVVLKLGSTLWRFARYYLGDPRYRRRGPPPLVFRVIGPILYLSTVILFISGIALWLHGPKGSAAVTLGLIHRTIFVVWFAAIALHVIGRILPALHNVFQDSAEHRLSDLRARRASTTRHLLIAGCLVLGLIIGMSVHALGYGWAGFVHAQTSHSVVHASVSQNRIGRSAGHS